MLHIELIGEREFSISNLAPFASLSIIKSISLSVMTIDSRKWCRNNCTRRGGSAVGRFGIVPAASLRPI